MDSRSFLQGIMSGLKLFVDFSLGLTGFLVMAVIVMAFFIIIPILMLSSFLWEVGQNLEPEVSSESSDINS